MPAQDQISNVFESAETIMNLFLRWCNLWQRLGAHSTCDPIFEELARRYREPHRAYHTLDHIQGCLLQFDQVRNLAEHADEVELALWCHDVIYDPHATDNEQRSAAWAGEILNEGQVSAEVSARVQALILATQHLTPQPPLLKFQERGSTTDSARERKGSDAALMIDIDLASLGYAAAEFDCNNAAIRQEYQWVPEAAYREERAKILESFLARPAIYQTVWFRDRYEAQARENLARAIQSLRETTLEP